MVISSMGHKALELAMERLKGFVVGKRSQHFI